MAAYQDDSIVSRQVTKADAGNVTLFAFDAGQELSEHTAPFDALVHVLDGEAEVTISGQRFRVGMGEAIILPAGQPHALKALSRFRMLLTMIRT
jgi:quercetin dioxygenase-like cupin family protein